MVCFPVVRRFGPVCGRRRGDLEFPPAAPAQRGFAAAVLLVAAVAPRLPRIAAIRPHQPGPPGPPSANAHGPLDREDRRPKAAEIRSDLLAVGTRNGDVAACQRGVDLVLDGQGPIRRRVVDPQQPDRADRAPVLLPARPGRRIGQAPRVEVRLTGRGSLPCDRAGSAVPPAGKQLPHGLELTELVGGLNRPVDAVLGAFVLLLTGVGLAQAVSVVGRGGHHGQALAELPERGGSLRARAPFHRSERCLSVPAQPPAGREHRLQVLPRARLDLDPLEQLCRDLDVQPVDGLLAAWLARLNHRSTGA
jgi:hypothetical protein